MRKLLSCSDSVRSVLVHAGQSTNPSAPAGERIKVRGLPIIQNRYEGVFKNRRSLAVSSFGLKGLTT